MDILKPSSLSIRRNHPGCNKMTSLLTGSTSLDMFSSNTSVTSECVMKAGLFTCKRDWHLGKLGWNSFPCYLLSMGRNIPVEKFQSLGPRLFLDCLLVKPRSIRVCCRWRQCLSSGRGVHIDPFWKPVFTLKEAAFMSEKAKFIQMLDIRVGEFFGGLFHHGGWRGSF